MTEVKVGGVLVYEGQEFIINVVNKIQDAKGTRIIVDCQDVLLATQTRLALEAHDQMVREQQASLPLIHKIAEQQLGGESEG